MRMIIWMCCVKFRDKLCCIELRQQLRIDNTLKMVERNRLRWCGQLDILKEKMMIMMTG